jgi:hypothetical protein
MIKEIVAIWENKKGLIEKTYRDLLYKKDWYPDYFDLILIVLTELKDEKYFNSNLEKIHLINDGTHEGNLVFIISEDTYTPYNYWYVLVDYGSCSGCDTLASIMVSTNDIDNKVKGLMSLSLHIIQRLKIMSGEPEK